MTRLIDADSIPWDVEGVGTIPVVTKEEIDRMPAVDAVPVVRCKDCVYHGEYKTCMRGDGLTVANDYDYCSNGVRKEK